ncbi:hypothetical protein ACVWXN_004497 [Bradyrhizobium sp. i1.4.4]
MFQTVTGPICLRSRGVKHTVLSSREDMTYPPWEDRRRHERSCSQLDCPPPETRTRPSRNDYRDDRTGSPLRPDPPNNCRRWKERSRTPKRCWSTIISVIVLNDPSPPRGRRAGRRSRSSSCWRNTSEAVDRSFATSAPPCGPHRPFERDDEESTRYFAAGFPKVRSGEVWIPSMGDQQQGARERYV